MTGTDSIQPQRNLVARVLSDVQFWVPVAVLICGLLLLEWIR